MTTVMDIIPDNLNVLHVWLIKSPAGKSFGLFHRVTIPPGASAATILAAVNSHLAEMGNDIVDATWAATVPAAVTTHHTPAAIAAYVAATTGASARV